MPSTDVPTYVELDGAPHQLLSLVGTEAHLINCDTGIEVTRHSADLAITPVVRRGRGAQEYLDVPARLAQKADLLADHVREVATGEWRDGTIRERYDPRSTSQETRIQRKIHDLEELGLTVSRRTIFRQLKAWRQDGRGGLVDGRGLREYDPYKGIPRDVQDVLFDVLKETQQSTTRTKKWVIDTVFRRLQQTHGLDYKLPAVSSMYRWLELYGDARYLTKSAATRSSAANRRKKDAFTKNVPLLPGGEVQVDTHTADVHVWVGEKLVRPLISVMLDVATRTVLAFTVRVTATRGVDHAYLLAQAFTPRQNRPDLSAVRAALDEQMPAHELLPWGDYIELAKKMPYIHIRALMMDNGKDYRSGTFRATTDAFGIDVKLSAPRTPTDKSHVERFFETFEQMFVQYLPGYCGGSPSAKGDETRTDLLTLDMFRALLDDWVQRDYHYAPHDGLRHPRHRKVRISPVAAASMAVMDIAQFHVPMTGMGYIGLLPIEYRKVADVGVKIGTFHYDSPELAQYRHKASNDPRHKGRWPVRVDPYNDRVVWFEAEHGTYIECHRRGAELEALRPYFGPAMDPDRASVANFDVAITGGPRPAPSAVPTVAAPSFKEDEDDDDFDYGTV